MAKIQYGESIGGNLQKSTWKFEMQDNVKISAGRFAIIKVDGLNINQFNQLENFIEKL